MVHALHEARRVLRPDGLLLDLRPAAVHRRVGLMQAERYRPVGIMRETFDDDRAADRAVLAVKGEGLFKVESRAVFTCNRTMDSLDEFQEWLANFVKLTKQSPHDWLVRRVEQALAVTGGKARVVVSGPLVLRVLRRRETTAQPAGFSRRGKRAG